MAGRLHPFSRPKENPSDLSHRLLADLHLMAAKGETPNVQLWAEKWIERIEAAALSGREAVGEIAGGAFGVRYFACPEWDKLPIGTKLYTTPQGDGWRPIAEAPKDGVVWLGCEGNMRLAFWHRTEERWIDHAAAEANEPVRGLRFTPTVWHDVPAAPSAKGVAP